MDEKISQRKNTFDYVKIKNLHKAKNTNIKLKDHYKLEKNNCNKSVKGILL